MSRLNSRVFSVFYLVAGVYFNLLSSINYYPQFYQPRTFFGEPRLAYAGLTTIEATLRGGHAFSGYDANGHKINVLGIYGCENLAAITQGVSESVLACNPDCILNTIWQYRFYNQNTGKLVINGKFSSIEFLPVFTQNFKHGFFASLSIPVKKLSIIDVSYTDLTTRGVFGSGIRFVDWQETTNQIEQIMACYGIHVGHTKTVGLGDVQLFGGWTINYEDTTVLDYIDATGALGVNFPTSYRADGSYVFALPLGYDGHVGIPLVLALSLGIFDWFTFGVQTGFLWFNDKLRCMPIKTAADQSGWIKLTRVPAVVQKGTIWHIDEYFKIDHLVGGFSVCVGFSHDHANRSKVMPIDSRIASRSIIESDERLAPWTTTAFHFVFEFDFATFDHPNVPRLALTIDKTIHGKRSFDTLITGAFIGIDFEW